MLNVEGGFGAEYDIWSIAADWDDEMREASTDKSCRGLQAEEDWDESEEAHIGNFLRG